MQVFLPGGNMHVFMPKIGTRGERGRGERDEEERRGEVKREENGGEVWCSSAVQYGREGIPSLFSSLLLS